MRRTGDYIDTLSEAFAAIGTWSFDHRSWVLGSCILVLVPSLLLASGVRFDNSMEAFFDKKDPTYRTYLQYRDDFGSDEVAFILYEVPSREHGVFDLDAMRRVQGLTEILEEEVPFILEVTSLANVEFVEGVEDGIDTYELLEDFPETQEELLAVREKVLAKDLYRDAIVSRDGKRASIVLKMDRSSVDPIEDIRLDPEGGDGLANLYPQASYHVIEEILARPEYEDFVFHHVGDVPLNAVFNERGTYETGYLTGLGMLVVAILLSLFFRRPVGVIGPLVVVGLGNAMVIAFAGLMGWSLDIMYMMVPNLIIAVGVANTVHLISEFRAFHLETGHRREAMRETLRLVGVPCLLTCLTTAAGFASLSIAPIKSIAHFAIFGVIGVFATFLLSITLLSVFFAFGRANRQREASERQLRNAKGGKLFRAGLLAISDFVVRRRLAIIAVWSVVFVVSAVGVTRLKVDSNFLNGFSKKEPLRIATHHVDDTMGGSMSFVYLFDSGEPDGIKDPEVLREIERVQARAMEADSVVKDSSSVVDVLKDINQAFNEGDPAYFRIPETRELVAQYLLVYEMSGGEELQERVSGDLARANLELRTISADSSVYAEFEADIQAYLDEEPLESSAVTLTGVGAMWLELMDYITDSQIRGFLLAFVVIAAFLCFIFKSVKIGLVAMIPNLAPVLITLGLMGWLDLQLDYTRLLIASVAIGISVDDTIHTVTRFALEFKRLGNYVEAFRAAMLSVGRAVVTTSVILVLCFLVYLFSSLDAIATFGTLLAGTVVMALVADLLLMPALILTFKSFGAERCVDAEAVDGLEGAGVVAG